MHERAPLAKRMVVHLIPSDEAEAEAIRAAVEHVQGVAARYGAWTRMGDARPETTGWYDVIWPDDPEPERVWLVVVDQDGQDLGLPRVARDPGDAETAVTEIRTLVSYPLEVAWRPAPAPENAE